MSSELPPPHLIFETSFFVGISVIMVLWGVQLTLAVLSFHYLWSAGAKRRRDSLFYVIYGFFMLLLLGIASFTNVVLGQKMWIQHRNDEGGPMGWFGINQSIWYSVFGSASSVVGNMLGDALLLYRCYIIWGSNKYIVFFPGLIFLASIALSIVTLVQSALPGSGPFADQTTNFEIPWVSLSVALNFIVTALISGRLLSCRQKVRKAVSEELASVYTGVVAILIESAAPFTALGIIFSALLGTENSAAVLFATVWGAYVGVAPQLIILRVAMGRSWTKDTLSELGIEFATRPTSTLNGTTFSKGTSSATGTAVGEKMDSMTFKSGSFSHQYNSSQEVLPK